MPLFLDSKKSDDNLVSAIASREEEIENYEINIKSFTHQLASPEMVTTQEALAKGLPADVISHRATRLDQIPPSVSDDDHDLIASVQHIDHLHWLMAGAVRELAKSQLAYESQLAQYEEIPEDRRSAAVKRFMAVRVAE